MEHPGAYPVTKLILAIGHLKTLVYKVPIVSEDQLWQSPAVTCDTIRTTLPLSIALEV